MEKMGAETSEPGEEQLWAVKKVNCFAYL